MSHASYFTYTPPKLGDLRAPPTLSCSDVSLVVPVRDNQAGIERFLTALFETHTTTTLPHEVIIVDNASAVPMRIPERFEHRGISVTLLHCSRRGPAAARNEGATKATSEWLLFADSDCTPTSSFITGYAEAMIGAVGYAGSVQAVGDGWLARYYESQAILEPPLDSDGRPLHLITANALVWRPAFEAAGGFDERFPDAAAEDIDLGLRLRQFGELACAPAAAVVHDFGDGVTDFVCRFVRYGRGNRRLGLVWDVDMRPRPFPPAVSTAPGWFAAILQYLSLLFGYFVTMCPNRQRIEMTGARRSVIPIRG
jgi:glycosyltransferase involved in cell wall biosynthesis